MRVLAAAVRVLAVLSTLPVLSDLAAVPSVLTIMRAPAALSVLAAKPEPVTRPVREAGSHTVRPRKRK